jgi:hypothetical protein
MGNYIFKPDYEMELVQRDAMLNDLKAYPEKEIGYYRGIRWVIDRPTGTYLCGYIYTSIKDSIEKLMIESTFHRGISFLVDNKVVGFRCNHNGDYAPTEIIDPDEKYLLRYFHDKIEYGLTKFKSDDTYKTHSFVYNILTKTINNLIELRKPIEHGYIHVKE